MSQSSFHSLGPDLISLSIAKFSHNTSPYGTRTYTWNHISTRSDLIFIIRHATCIDEHRKQETRVIMKVSAGQEEMETQDLHELVHFCNHFDPSSGAEHPVEVAIRSPLIAMRYPKTVNTVRRLQVRFRNREDYQKVYNVLKDLGLPITNRETTLPGNSQPPPSPAPSNTTSTASTPNLLRPSSAIEIPSNYSNTALEPAFKMPPRPVSAMSEDGARTNEVSRITRPFSTSFVNPVVYDPTLFRAHSFQSGTDPIFNPFQVEKEARRPSLSTSQVSDHFIPSAQPKTSLYIDQMQNVRPRVSEKQEDASQPLAASPFYPRAIEAGPSDSGHAAFGVNSLVHPNISQADSMETHQQSNPISFDPSTYRSSSDLALPPRRELPLLKGATSNRPRTSSPLDLPQMSKSTPVILPPSKSPKIGQQDLKTPASKPAPKKRVAQRKAPTAKASATVSSVPQLNADEHVIAEPASVPEEPSPLAAKSAAAIARPASTPMALVSKVAPPPRKRTTTPAIRPSSSNKRVKMVDQTTQTEKVPDQPPIVQKVVSRQETTADVVPNAVSSPPDQYLNAVDNFVAKHKARPPPTELSETPGWADADDVYRQRLIDNFICENLENAEFLKLCEDVGTSWRRIGLGM